MRKYKEWLSFTRYFEKKMNYPLFSDEYFMNEALKEAQKAFERDEIPVGAVIVSRDRIIARGHNMTEELTDVTAHAEMIVITAASNFLGSKFLDECSLYVSLEPCLMCAGAINWARPARLIYGASEPKAGYTNFTKKAIHPRTEIKASVLDLESSLLLKEYFSGKR